MQDLEKNKSIVLSSFHTIHFQVVTIKQYYTFSQSLYQTIMTPPELLSNNTVK